MEIFEFQDLTANFVLSTYIFLIDLVSFFSRSIAEQIGYQMAVHPFFDREQQFGESCLFYSIFLIIN